LPDEKVGKRVNQNELWYDDPSREDEFAYRRVKTTGSNDEVEALGRGMLE
jgi:hypothetical protein